MFVSPKGYAQAPRSGVATMFRTIPHKVIGAALAASLLMPAAAIACSIEAPTPNARPIPKADSVLPTRHDGRREAWGLRPVWRSIRPSLMATTRVVGGSRDGQPGTAQRSARTLRFLANVGSGSRRWYDDLDPATTCDARGRQVYTQPRLLARETKRAVFVTFVTRRLPDPAGCVSWAPGDPPLSGDQVVLVGSCDDVATAATRLRRPIGDRNVVLGWFAPA